jgi:hypothetical protein
MPGLSCWASLFSAENTEVRFFAENVQNECYACGLLSDASAEHIEVQELAKLLHRKCSF